MKAVGGHRRGVDEPLRAGGRGGLEDVARAGQVDLAALAAAGDDREGEVDDDVGALDQLVDRLAVEHVAAPVLGLLPAVAGQVEGPPRHADHPLHLRHALEGGDEGLPISPVGPVTATVSMRRFWRNATRDGGRPRRCSGALRR